MPRPLLTIAAELRAALADEHALRAQQEAIRVALQATGSALEQAWTRSSRLRDELVAAAAAGAEGQA